MCSWVSLGLLVGETKIHALCDFRREKFKMLGDKLEGVIVLVIIEVQC